jgi:hypothetical protein
MRPQSADAATAASDPPDLVQPELACRGIVDPPVRSAAPFDPARFQLICFNFI